jgi:hypothetical protein
MYALLCIETRRFVNKIDGTMLLFELWYFARKRRVELEMIDGRHYDIRLLDE